MSTHKKIHWGILGAARINQQLMPAIIEAKNSQLIAIASRRPGAAKATLQQYAPDSENVHIYPSADELLKNPHIQAVYIPLATEDHAQWTLRAIEQGKHVLCEKPLAMNISDIDAIAATAKKQQLQVMEGFMYRFHPQHQRIQEIINAGTIGEVRSVRSCFSYPMQAARLYRVGRPINQGGGGMWDIGCYAIDAARLCFGNTKARAVTAMAQYNEQGADTSSSGIIDFGNGRYAQFNFSYAHARRAEYEMIGTKGGLKCHNAWAKATEKPVISWQTDAGEEHTEHLSLSNHFVLEVEHFCACILENKAPKLSLQDAKANCEIILAALQSVKQGRIISLL